VTITNLDVEIRRWSKSDDITRITELLHSAYAELDTLGFRYHATWQGNDVTEGRLSKGISYVAVHEKNIVGTITLYTRPAFSGCTWYDREDVAYFGQFGVDPAFQKSGIGTALLETVELEAKQLGIPNLALDTAEGATHLINLYKDRGYVFVCYADWDITNYRSVILNKELD